MLRKLIILGITLLTASHTLAQKQPDVVRRYNANAQQVVDFDIRENRDPSFPLSLKHRGVERGEATFAIFVNQFGELSDHLLLEATHMEFAEAVEKVIPDWDYSVPYIDGETAAIVSRIKVTFERGKGVVYEKSGVDILASLAPTASKDPYDYRTYGIDELDALPEPIHIEKPSFHVDLLEERDLVSAVFEFYIDTEGNVRIPTLRQADDRVDERLLLIAQEALLEWKFNAPTFHGKPVVARAAQPFRFQKSGVDLILGL